MTPLLLTLIALALLFTLATILGHGLLRLAGGLAGSVPYRRTLELAAGLMALHLLLGLLQLAGIPWNPLSVAILLVASILCSLLPGRGRERKIGPEEESLPFRPSWGDGLAFLGVLGFAAAGWTLRATHPDFIYHWGVKAKRFLLAGGIDWSYLARPWNHYTHPDYPRLVSELHALAALPAHSLQPGSFEEPALLLGSAVFLLGAVIGLREALARSGAGPLTVQGGTAGLGLGLGGFAIGMQQAGGADLPLTLALTVALPPLLTREPKPGDDLALGIAAAFAAASKIEGVVLAAFLGALYLLRSWRDERWRQGRSRRRWAAASALAGRVLLPPVFIVLPWLAANLHHGLFQAANTGAPRWERWPAILRAAGDALGADPWHGAAWLVLAAPLLLVPKTTRLLAGVVLLQMVFYLWIYLTMTGDVALLVWLSLPRLVLPLVPAVMVGLLVALNPRKTPSSQKVD